MRRQAGQSMAEFAAGSSVLALLLLGSLALGGFQESDRRLVLSARQAAWQQSWTPQHTDAAMRGRELHRQNFADPGVMDPTGRRLLVAEDDLVVSASYQEATGAAGTAAELMVAPLRTVSGFLGSGFDLRDDGMTGGNLRAHLEPLTALPRPFDTLELELNVSHALLGDAWHAGGTRHVQQRAGGLVPSTRLAALNSIWRPLAAPLSIVEPSLGQLCLGAVEADRVPEDRLGPGRTPLPDRCP
jgi:hypothetical protein